MTGPGFGDNADKFRRRIHTDRGPMYIETREGEPLPPTPWTRALLWAIGGLLRAAGSVLAVYLLAEYAHDDTNRVAGITGATCLFVVFLLFVGWPDWTHKEVE